jgi:peptidoglycan hydrolase-like protein with peptidoglycan-binding domain
MEFVAYSSMVIANQEANGQAEYLEYELPKFEFNWRKLVKSSAWLSVAGLMVLLTTLTQAALAAYVRTNGSCLNVRNNPSPNAEVVDCIPNGTQISTVGKVNGFVQLSDNRFVSGRWVSGSSSSRPNKPMNSGGGVGGRVTLSLGSRGQAVSDVQRVLGIEPTGYYGSVTARRVREFQSNNGLRADGVVGTQTRNALFSGSRPPTGGPVTLSLGSRGQAVSDVQRALGVEPTGYFGSVTVRRVREFQSNNGLRVDGVVGPETRSALLRG